MGCLVFSSLSSSLYMCWFILKWFLNQSLIPSFHTVCPLCSLHRYDETSCTAKQIPSRLWPGGEEWPMLRWYPGVKGHMGQCPLYSQPQVCCPNYWRQWRWSFPRSPSSQGKWMVYHVVVSATVHKHCIVWFNRAHQSDGDELDVWACLHLLLLYTTSVAHIE